MNSKSKIQACTRVQAEGRKQMTYKGTITLGRVKRNAYNEWTYSIQMPDGTYNEALRYYGQDRQDAEGTRKAEAIALIQQGYTVRIRAEKEGSK